jgi:hypothetical protein
MLHLLPSNTQWDYQVYQDLPQDKFIRIYDSTGAMGIARTARVAAILYYEEKIKQLRKEGPSHDTRGNVAEVVWVDEEP